MILIKTFLQFSLGKASPDGSMVIYTIIEFEFLKFLVASEVIYGGRSVTREPLVVTREGV